MDMNKTDFPHTIEASPDYGLVNVTIPKGRSLKVESSAMAYMASSLKMKTKMGGGLKRMLSGEKLFMIKVSGTGDLWFNSYGGVIDIDVKDNYVVDTGYIVAFTSGLSYDVRPVAGLKSLFFSGEGLVCRFSGEGKVWIQTRLAPAFTTWADPFRKVEKKK